MAGFFIPEDNFALSTVVGRRKAAVPSGGPRRQPFVGPGDEARRGGGLRQAAGSHWHGSSPRLAPRRGDKGGGRGADGARRAAGEQSPAAQPRP